MASTSQLVFTQTLSAIITVVAGHFEIHRAAWPRAASDRELQARCILHEKYGASYNFGSDRCHMAQAPRLESPGAD